MIELNKNDNTEENTDRNSISLDKNQYTPLREKEPIPASRDAGGEMYPTQEIYPVNSNSSIAEASSPSSPSTQIPTNTQSKITLRFATTVFDDEFKQYSHNRTYSDIMNKIIEELLILEDTDKHIILDTNQEYVYENILRLFQIPLEMFSTEVSEQIYSTIKHLQRIITYPTTKTNLTILMAQMDIIGTIYKQHVLKWKHRVRKDMKYELESGGYYSYKNICKFIFNYSKTMLEYSDIISKSKPIESIFKQVYDYIVKRLSGVIYVMGPMTFDMDKNDPGYIEIVNKLLCTTLSKYTSSIGVSDTAYNSMVQMVRVSCLIDDSKRKNHPETPLSSIRNEFFS